MDDRCTVSRTNHLQPNKIEDKKGRHCAGEIYSSLMPIIFTSFSNSPSWQQHRINAATLFNYSVKNQWHQVCWYCQEAWKDWMVTLFTPVTQGKCTCSDACKDGLPCCISWSSDNDMLCSNVIVFVMEISLKCQFINAHENNKWVASVNWHKKMLTSADWYHGMDLCCIKWITIISVISEWQASDDVWPPNAALLIPHSQLSYLLTIVKIDH